MNMKNIIFVLAFIIVPCIYSNSGKILKPIFSYSVWSPKIFVFDSQYWHLYSIHCILHIEFSNCIQCDVLYALNCNNCINYCFVKNLLYPVLYIYSSYILHIVFAALYRMLSLLWILNMHFNVCINFYVLHFKDYILCIVLYVSYYVHHIVKQMILCIVVYASYSNLCIDYMHCNPSTVLHAFYNYT